jgi:hypothetical protein
MTHYFVCKSTGVCFTWLAAKFDYSADNLRDEKTLYEKHLCKQENVSQYGRAMGVSAGYNGYGLEDYIVFHHQKTRLQISVSGADSIV